MAKVVCVSTTIPSTDIQSHMRAMTFRRSTKYPDGQTAPTPQAIDFKPGEMLGSVSGELGLRKFLEGPATPSS